MPRTCFNWCEEDHEHNFDKTNRVFHAKRDVLTTAERDSLELQLGFRPRTRSEVDPVLKSQGLEFVSQSGSDGQFRKELHEWRRESPDKRGEPPVKKGLTRRRRGGK